MLQCVAVSCTHFAAVYLSLTHVSLSPVSYTRLSLCPLSLSLSWCPLSLTHVRKTRETPVLSRPCSLVMQTCVTRTRPAGKCLHESVLSILVLSMLAIHESGWWWCLVCHTHVCITREVSRVSCTRLTHVIHTSGSQESTSLSLLMETYGHSIHVSTVGSRSLSLVTEGSRSLSLVIETYGRMDTR